MLIHESHCHSLFSADVDRNKGATIDKLCQTALERGCGSIAVTDHLEIDQIKKGYIDFLDNEGVKKEISLAKEKYKNKIQVVYGVELAQECHDMRITENILKKYKYDFIVGSVHCVRDFPDYSEADFFDVDDSYLKLAWEKYVSELKESVEWGGFDTLAHITYPYRYYHRHGKEYILDIENTGKSVFEPIFKSIIEKGIALEVNTSGIRQGDGGSFPPEFLIKLYKEMGGELVTVGSDAHKAEDIAKDIPQIYELLKTIGFKYVCSFYERKPIFHKFD